MATVRQLKPHEYSGGEKVLVTIGAIWIEIARLQLTPEQWAEVAAHFEQASKKPDVWANTTMILAMVPT